MTDVIKRNGEKEPFSEEKIKNSIESAVKDAGFKTQSKKRLIDKTLTDINRAVQGKEEISTAKIRNIVINDIEQDFDEDQAPVVRAWRNYELKHDIIHRE
ncbi:ATP cone domain-containing protein [Methanobacterium sp.]|jgi:transcriptional regulator NrdR family protein|uniref:ATP cone domain-containing protein n=1 Tax=Methanobacterium sp. TaxID=2164 RepID=UPI00315878EB